MKRIILRFPVNKAGEIADIIGENGFVTLLCWTVTDSIFDTNLKCHLAIPPDKSDFAKVTFAKYIQQS